MEWMHWWGLLGSGGQTAEERWYQNRALPHPSSSRPLQSPLQASGAFLQASACSLCQRTVSTAWISCRAWAFPLMGWLTGLNSQWRPPTPGVQTTYRVGGPLERRLVCIGAAIRKKSPRTRGGLARPIGFRFPFQ